ncbi:Nuclear transport factor 2B [Sesamum angolense]|uniref:NTF2-related export protein n=1 Tax=Sesamum angolense TaxID=2727404 RepID=A0AAE1W4P2_9LAMI|nr:Nuclear transport factor 2B [Sesamum angolense]
MEEQVEVVGKAFVDHYYHLFDNNRTALVSLYQPTSMLTFEGQRIHGIDDISAKLNQLPFNQCRHVISTVDSQASAFAGGVVVFVSGSLQLQGEEHPLRFSQVQPLLNFLISLTLPSSLTMCCIADVSPDSNGRGQLFRAE